MVELSEEDREEIQNQITEYKANQVAKPANPIAVPMTPDGQDANQALDEAIKQQATPDKKEARRVKKKIKGIWRNWRTTTLDAKSLEIEKLACQISVERAETKAKLDKIRREEEAAEVKHWLSLNAGNLEEVEMNTNSKPSKFWYGFRRGFHHITKLTNNIPRIFKNLFWIGILVVGLVLLKHFNVL